jgi:predicted PurR-regulated permease PerM
VLVGAEVGAWIGGLFGGLIGVLLAVPAAATIQVIVIEAWTTTESAQYNRRVSDNVSNEGDAALDE